MPSHVKEIVLRNQESFGFLKGYLSSVPDFEVNVRLDPQAKKEITGETNKRKAKEIRKGTA